MDFWATIQTVGLILSFLYLWLEFHQKPLMWIISAMCSMIYASVYFHSKIYADMGFSCFNICMCVYGFIKWLHGDRKRASQDIVYRHFRGMEFLSVLGVSAIIWGAIFCILRFLTDSPVPVLDALTTMLNIVGTGYLHRRSSRFGASGSWSTSYQSTSTASAACTLPPSCSTASTWVHRSTVTSSGG